MYDLAQFEVRLEPRHDLVLHQMLHFVGYARQRNDHFAAAFEPHARRRAVRVEQHRAAGRNQSLSAVEVVEFDAPLFEHPFYMVGDGLVRDEFAAEHFGQRLFGDVVLGGAESAGDDCDVRLAEGAFHAPDDLRAVIADRDFFMHDDARGVEVAGDGYGIGIHDLTDEDFIADSDDRCFHKRCF